MAEPTKIVILIRHGETEGNIRCRSLCTSCCCGIHRVFGDPELTSNGRDQATDVARQLNQADFVRKQGLELVVHSTLRRARDTCGTLFGTSGIQTVRLGIFNEWYPTDWLPCPGTEGNFEARVRKCKAWLASRPERVIAVVGHGAFFKALQDGSGARHLKNLEVRKCVFDVTSQTFDAGETLYKPRGKDEEKMTKSALGKPPPPPPPRRSTSRLKAFLMRLCCRGPPPSEDLPKEPLLPPPRRERSRH